MGIEKFQKHNIEKRLAIMHQAREIDEDST